MNGAGVLARQARTAQKARHERSTGVGCPGFLFRHQCGCQGMFRAAHMRYCAAGTVVGNAPVQTS
jgi:hypothetical protein